MITAVFLYLINNYLVFWLEMPGSYNLFSHYGWLGLEALNQPLEGSQITWGWVQVIAYLGILAASIYYVRSTEHRSLEDEAVRFSVLSSFLIRFAFWAILSIGLVDMLISMLRVEGFLSAVVGEKLASELGRPIFRGQYVHYPLTVTSLFLALRFRNISFTWLTLMVVFAEFMIVITRFIFSYEQAYMGDLVRFWYAGLFLFASAHTLVEGGHVRVDVLYAGFSRRKKAIYDSFGCVILGLPMCWVILMQGMGGRGNSINSPLLSFEVSQSGYGMYTKYMMAGYLVVFAVTMLIQFI
ncbi:MAG: TRAP transporter small permease subunit, partial [Pseudomonadota bacterium]